MYESVLLDHYRLVWGIITALEASHNKIHTSISHFQSVHTGQKQFKIVYMTSSDRLHVDEKSYCSAFLRHGVLNGDMVEILLQHL